MNMNIPAILLPLRKSIVDSPASDMVTNPDTNSIFIYSPLGSLGRVGVSFHSFLYLVW